MYGIKYTKVTIEYLFPMWRPCGRVINGAQTHLHKTNKIFVHSHHPGDTKVRPVDDREGVH